jgi:hypothetical protein
LSPDLQGYLRTITKITSIKSTKSGYNGDTGDIFDKLFRRALGNKGIELQKADKVNDENYPIQVFAGLCIQPLLNVADVMYLADFVIFSFYFIQFSLVILF